MIVAKYAAYCKAYHLPSGGLRGAGSSIFSEQVLPLRSMIDYLLTVMEHPRSARFQTNIGFSVSHHTRLDAEVGGSRSGTHLGHEPASPGPRAVHS